MPKVRTAGEDAKEQRLLDDISKYGWHCVNVLAEGEEGPYSFTVGLFHTHKHPELIIFGLKSEVARKILSNAVEGLPQGKRLDLNAPTDELLVGYSCCFVEVPVSQYREHVGFARWYYGGNEFPLYQIVWPSRDGYFPWHPKASQEFRQCQPVVGHSPVGI